MLEFSILLCWVLAAIANAVMDTLAHHYDQSIFKNNKNQKWWDPRISWANKYTPIVSHKKPKFFGSTTFLVFITDAWHFFQFLSNSLIVVSIILALNGGMDIPWYHNIGLFLLFKALWGVAFEKFYSKVFIK